MNEPLEHELRTGEDYDAEIEEISDIVARARAPNDGCYWNFVTPWQMKYEPEMMDIFKHWNEGAYNL